MRDQEWYNPPKETTCFGRRLLYHGWFTLPKGNSLFVYMDPTVGALEYWSDEVGGGVMVWQSALVDPETLEAAIKHWRNERDKKVLCRALQRLRPYFERVCCALSGRR